MDDSLPTPAPPSLGIDGVSGFATPSIRTWATNRAPAWSDIWRALSPIMGEDQRDAFVDPFDLDSVPETTCIRRLVTSEDHCPHSTLQADPDPTGPPHKPPAAGHATLWPDHGEPAVYEMHIYSANIERLKTEKPPHN